MITGVRRGKTGTHGTITHQYPDIVGKFRVMTGSQTENKTFYDITAHLVAERGRHHQQKRPSPAFFAKIESNKHKEKEVKRHPEFRFPQKGEKKVGYWACPVLVDLGKQPMISLQYLLYEPRMTVTVK